MVSAIEVRVLLDTGPTSDEVEGIRRIFSRVGLNATVEGHSYGGPPPTSAFLIVINAPLAPFLDHFAGLDEGGPIALMDLVAQLAAMRRDTTRWGRAHGVRLEDSHTGLYISLPESLRSPAYASLLGLDLSGYDMSSPATRIEWDSRFERWVGRLTSSPRQVARRLPSRSRGSTRGDSRTRYVTEPEIERLWATVSRDGESAVTWQRAMVVLLSAMGWSTESVARRISLSEPRVRAVLANFNRDGFSSLAPDYSGGETVRLSKSERREAASIARRSPTELGLTETAWSSASLIDYLVAAGCVEDADPAVLEVLADDGAVKAGR